MAPSTQDPQRLRRRRIEAGLNQGELAEKAEISASYMSCLALGTRSASPRVLKRLAKALNCKVSDLLPPEPETTTDTDSEAGAA
ncbi:helix-turn-helix transcriptional regulator [Streptomyces monashensis]|uniref:helix-turn-helix domain-containing protein n=1 Tax=Streptomyces monashensis TaxID=1678012 RepID=UPI0033C86ED9